MSGGRREVFNKFERVVSPDQNRVQKFTAYERAELLRMLLGSNPGSLQLGSYSAPSTTVGTPLEGHILDGLMVIVQVGGTELGVQAGEVLLVDPDGQAGSSVATAPDPDDSVCKLVKDAGITIGSGSLVMTANNSGSTKYDIVECRRKPGVVIETDTRDSWNPATGAFAPGLVAKYKDDQLEYRIRRVAATVTVAQGWLPLAVAVVPNLSVTWDTCTFYDVRPLVRERVPMAFNGGQDGFPKRKSYLWNQFKPAAAQQLLRGVFETSYGGYYAGGDVYYRDSAAGAGVIRQYIDMHDTAFQEPGFAAANNTIYYVWLLFPYGLPRWRLYSVAAVAPYGGRIPYTGLCGIPVVSATAPSFTPALLPSAAIAPPSVSGLPAADTTLLATLMTAVMTNGAAEFLPFAYDEDWCVFGNDTGGGGGSGVQLTPATAVTATEDFFDLVAGTHFPKNAKSLRLLMVGNFTGAGGTVFQLYNAPALMKPGSTTIVQAYGPQSEHEFTMPGGGAITLQYIVDVPLLPTIPDTGTQRIGMLWGQNGGIVKVNNSICRLIGWRNP